METAKRDFITGTELYNLFKDFNTCSLSYVYKGIFNATLTDKILSLAETNMNIVEETYKTQKRVYFVMVESLQNITRHQDINQSEQNHAFFVVQNRSGEYNLTSANIVEDNKIDHLKTSIDKINSLNPDELKDYYKYVLENTGLSDKGGAGLGLIEMARKSGNKLSYSFDPVDKQSSFFYFKTKITADAAGNGAVDDMKKEKLLHELSKQHHINMIYQGIFTQENLKSLLTMTEGSIARNDDLAYKRKVVSIMVELLQNICNHSAPLSEVAIGSPGIIVVATTDKGCFIYSGNYINNENIDKIRNKIIKVNLSSIQELEDLYESTIMKEQEPGQKGAGLGFIDIKMKSGNDIQYSIEVYNSDYSFITLTAFIPY
jgi:hypothetical protein